MCLRRNFLPLLSSFAVDSSAAWPMLLSARAEMWGCCACWCASSATAPITRGPRSHWLLRCAGRNCSYSEVGCLEIFLRQYGDIFFLYQMPHSRKKKKVKKKNYHLFWIVLCSSACESVCHFIMVSTARQMKTWLLTQMCRSPKCVEREQNNLFRNR